MLSTDGTSEEPLHVLIVDDDPDVVEQLTCVLEGEGCRITSVMDSREALRACAQYTPDFVILDIMLPCAGAVAACRVLRNDSCFACVPIIVSTDLTHMVEVQEALAVGADDYIVRPCDVRDLMTRMCVARQARLLVAIADKNTEEIESLARDVATAETHLPIQVANDLHDNVIQTLVGTRMWLEHAAGDETIRPTVRWQIVALMEEVDKAVLSGRSLLRDSRSTDTDAARFVEALRERAVSVQRESGVEVEFEVLGDVKQLPESTGSGLYRIVREAVLNAARHAQAERLSIRMEVQPDQVVAVIEDNGRGFDPSAIDVDGHIGLESLADRAEMLGGSTDVDTTPGYGTRVMVWLPIGGGVSA